MAGVIVKALAGITLGRHYYRSRCYHYGGNWHPLTEAQGAARGPWSEDQTHPASFNCCYSMAHLLDSI